MPFLRRFGWFPIRGQPGTTLRLELFDRAGYVRSNPAILLKLIQIGVGRGIAQDTAHRDDLAFVMESVSQDVMEDDGGRPDRDVSIGEMQLRGGNEVLLAKE